MNVTSFGAAGEVTGSCHLIETGSYRILLDCGLFQGSAADEARNAKPFMFDVGRIDAVILSHAHIDHSGRLPLLVKSGYSGPIYTHKASADLLRIMLRDAAYLARKDAEWENRKRERKGLVLIEPLYTQEDVEAVLARITPLDYGQKTEILSGVDCRLQDAGHILGAAIVELWLGEGARRKIVYSGDLGHHGSVLLREPAKIESADVLLLESTYGDRNHCAWEATLAEIGEVFSKASTARGNILVPAFAVGRTQALIHLLATNYARWGLERWQIVLDSPMAIEATEVYCRHNELYNDDAAPLWRAGKSSPVLRDLYYSRSSADSMRLNQISSGALIIAGSGMCSGGRIMHHLKHHIWRENCHVVITGFQGHGTLGRALVDGARRIRLWGETVRVAATVHTIGGLSAHADQQGLVSWVEGFAQMPRILLVHGESAAQQALRARLMAGGADCAVMRPGEAVPL